MTTNISTYNPLKSATVLNSDVRQLLKVTEQKRCIEDGLMAEEVGKQGHCPSIHLYYTGVQCRTIHLPPE